MNMKKVVSLVLTVIMLITMSATAFAQAVDSGKNGSGSITIPNAAKGIEYKVVKLFDATVTGADNGSIAYTGNIPAELAEYFVQFSSGNIAVKEGVTDEAVITAVQDWAKKQTDFDATAVSDGSALTFTNLQYGYYAVVTAQGAVVTIASTNPSATVYDKNTTKPVELVKSVDDDDVFVGQTVTYTVSFKTANFNGSGESAKKIVEYTIEDTLPGFLKDVTVTKITIGGTEYKVNGTVPQFDNKKIDIPWVDANGNSLYASGAEVVITYTATVTDQAQIAGNGNVNKVTLTWKDDDPTTPDDDKLEDDATIYTYAIALKKVNEKGEALAGATFEFPFYVKETPDTDGAYIYAGTAAGEGLTNKITTPENGEIVVKGVASGTYSITETKAPDGYNVLSAPVSVTAVKTSQTTTSTTTYLDKDGNIVSTETETVVEYNNEKLAATVVVVVNKTGAELPETGAQGTKMIYIAGGILVAAAAVLLITKRRMNAAE